MATCDKNIGVMGNNPWDIWSEEDQAFTITLRQSDDMDYMPGKTSKFVFTDGMPNEIRGLLSVYEFYRGCIDAARHMAFDDTSIDKCFGVEFNASDKDAVIYTVAYFGYDEVRKRLIKYKKDIPYCISDAFKPIVSLKIKKNKDSRKISYIYSDDSPFPKLEEIN